MRTMIGLFLITTLVTAAPIPKTPKTPDYFPIKEGSTWEYSVADTQNKDQTEEKVTISKVTKKGDEITAIEEGRGSGGKPAKIRVTPKAITFIENELGKDAEWVLWKTDAKKGDSWTSKVDFGATGLGGTDLLIEVGGIEEIKVPAGKYQAQLVVISFTIPLSGVPNISVSMKMWLVDGVGIARIETSSKGFKEEQISRISELKKYTPGK